MNPSRGWIPTQDELLGKFPDKIVAKLVNKKLQAVQQRRHRLGVTPLPRPPSPARPPRAPGRKSLARAWTAGEEKLLGMEYDWKIAKVLNRKTVEISKRRRKLGIPRYRRNQQ